MLRGDLHIPGGIMIGLGGIPPLDALVNVRRVKRLKESITADERINKEMRIDHIPTNIEYLLQEAEEVKDAFDKRDAGDDWYGDTLTETKTELGDLLFTCAVLADNLASNPNSLLGDAISKLRARHTKAKANWVPSKQTYKDSWEYVKRSER